MDQLVVDGVIFHRQPRGGISRIFHEILPRMCALDDTLRISLLVQPDAERTLPFHRHLEPVGLSLPLRSLPWLGRSEKRLRVAKAVLQQLIYLKAKRRWGDALWMSTYYTLPPVGWRGPSVVFVYDMIHELFPSYFRGPRFDWFRLVKRKCVERADRILCISDATADDVSRLYRISPSKLRTVHLGFHHSFAAEDGHTPSDQPSSFGPVSLSERPYFLFIGTRKHYKNFASLARCFARLRRELECRLVLVGAELQTDERQRLAQLGISSDVIGPAFVSEEELRWLYQGAAALVYPSEYEGFGIPLVEAMVSGTPIIASRIPSTLEVAGDIPHYFALGDDEALLAAMRHCATSPVSPEAREASLMRGAPFTWDATAEAVLRASRELR